MEHESHHRPPESVSPYKRLCDMAPGEQAKTLYPSIFKHRGYHVRRFAYTGMTRGNAAIVVLAPPQKTRLCIAPLFAPLHKDIRIKRGGWAAPPKKSKGRKKR